MGKGCTASWVKMSKKMIWKALKNTKAWIGKAALSMAVSLWLSKLVPGWWWHRSDSRDLAASVQLSASRMQPKYVWILTLPWNMSAAPIRSGKDVQGMGLIRLSLLRIQKVVLCCILLLLAWVCTATYCYVSSKMLLAWLYFLGFLRVWCRQLRQLRMLQTKRLKIKL